MSTSGNTVPGGGDSPSGPDGRNHGEEFAAIANVVVSVIGGVYAATESTLLAALALGTAAFLWFVLRVGRREHER